MREKIQKWLSPPDPSTNHNEAREVHQKVTPEWFLEGPIYNKWKAKGSPLWAHGNRTIFILSPLRSLIVTGFVAGSGKSVLWWATPLADFVDVAYIGDQFVDHRGHQTQMCNRIGLIRILLL
jgi:hypothetical protein